MHLDIESVCTYCGVGCDITAQVEDNKIIKIYAQRDGYVSQGKLCIKGKHGYDFVESSERIRKPKIRKSFIEENYEDMPRELKARSKTLKCCEDKEWFSANYDFATSLAAWKLSQIKQKYGKYSFAAIGGARTSCESGYMLQKFTRECMESPHIDNCARVCHSPSLKGLRSTIGEGAATNPYDDIYKAEFILIIGSNTSEAHPIVANRIIEATRAGTPMAVIDVREIQISKFAKYKAIIPHESNLLVLNMIAHTIITENLYHSDFVTLHTKEFEEYAKNILEDEYANPEFFQQIKGYEYLTDEIKNIARDYATKKSMIFWGLGVTEHLDGSYAVMAIAHLAMMTGNIGKSGAGLMPLRGQNNVQGACDVGCLPYYDPDYKTPKEVGFMTPDMVDAMIKGDIKALYNMGEDIAHIHPNQNKVQKGLENLELIIVQELFMNEIAKKADIVFGVKSAYEKTGVYVNAMRRLHLSQPLVENDLPDDWEVLRDIENKINGEFLFDDSEQVWDETRDKVGSRYGGASYQKLSRHRSKGMQWPIFKTDTPILHKDSFRTEDGKATFCYHKYKLRGMVKELISFDSFDGFYLTTGRTLVHYNNAAQTSRSEKLNEKYDTDVILASKDDEILFNSHESVILKSKYGESAKLPVKFSDKIKKGTLFTTFHHASSRINYLFGDEADELVKTACFKSIKVEIV